LDHYFAVKRGEFGAVHITSAIQIMLKGTDS
jgi:hypothetical protein